MEIKTKFNMGDDSFYIADNRIQKGKIIHIQINIEQLIPSRYKTDKTNTKIQYTIANLANENVYRTEDQVWASKADIIAE